METVIPFIYSPLMIRILALLLFILPQFGYANLSCINLFNESDFRIELRNNDITLTPLNKSYKKNLKELYENEDVARFFLGGEPSVDAVKNHIQRAQKKSGGSPEVFDGQWVIKKDGEIVGSFAMTAVEKEFLPIEVQKRFTKTKPSDLYLAVGYALLPEFRGQGIVSTALNMGLHHAKTALKAKYVFASANNLNIPSQNVLESNGFLRIYSDVKRTKYFIELN